MQIQRRNSQWDAREFIEAFVREGWESHWSSITITCDITLQELQNIGHLPRSQGTRECRKLLRAPVINDEIGTALWEELATMARGGDSPLDYDDLEAICVWNQGIARECMRQEINAMRHHNETGHRRSMSPPPRSPRSKHHHDGDNNRMPCIRGQPHLSPSPLSVTRPPEIQIVSPALSILRTNKPTTANSEMVVAGTGASESPRKLSWSLPLPLAGRHRSSAATGLSATSSTLTSTPTTPVTPPKSCSSILRNNNTGGMVREDGFWQQNEKQEVRRVQHNEPFAIVDRETTSPELVSAFTTSTSTGWTKKTLSFPRRILRKLNSTDLLGNIGDFGQSLGAGYGSRDYF